MLGSCLPSVTSPSTYKQIGLFSCWFFGGWFCVHSRNLWVSPTNSPVRLRVSLGRRNPHGFLQPDVLRLYFPTWNPGLYSLSHSSVVPPGLISIQIWDCPVWKLLSCQSFLLPCPTSSALAAHFLTSSQCGWMFLNCLVVWLPGRSGCYLFLNLLLFWLCEEAKRIYLHLQESFFFFSFFWTAIFIFVI